MSSIMKEYLSSVTTIPRTQLVYGILVVINAGLFTMQVVSILRRVLYHSTPSLGADSFVESVGQISGLVLPDLPETLLNCVSYMMNMPNQTVTLALRSCLPSDNISIHPKKSFMSLFSDLILSVSVLSAGTYFYLHNVREVPLGGNSHELASVSGEASTPVQAIDEDQVRSIVLSSSAATAELSNALLKQLQAGLESSGREVELLKGKIYEVAQTAKSDSRNLQGRLNRGGDVRRELEKLREMIDRLGMCVYQITGDVPLSVPISDPEQQGNALSSSSKCVLTIDGIQFDLATETGRDEWHTFLANRKKAQGSELVTKETSDTDQTSRQPDEVAATKKAQDAKYYTVELSDDSRSEEEDVKENQRPALSVNTEVDSKGLEISAGPEAPTTAAAPIKASHVPLQKELLLEIRDRQTQTDKDLIAGAVKQLQDEIQISESIHRAKNVRASSSETAANAIVSEPAPRAESVPVTPSSEFVSRSNVQHSTAHHPLSPAYNRKGPQTFQRWINNANDQQGGSNGIAAGRSRKIGVTQQAPKRYSSSVNNPPVDPRSNTTGEKLRVNWARRT